MELIKSSASRHTATSTRANKHSIEQLAITYDLQFTKSNETKQKRDINKGGAQVPAILRIRGTLRRSGVQGYEEREAETVREKRTLVPRNQKNKKINELVLYSSILKPQRVALEAEVMRSTRPQRPS